MFAGPIHSVVAVVMATVLSLFSLGSCLCSTATAVESDSSDMAASDASSDCCPFSKQEENEEPDEGPAHDSCCSDCNMACGEPGERQAHELPSAVVVSADEMTDVEEADKTWWTPELVATLWLAERLAEFDDQPPIAIDSPSEHRPDCSGTYLKTSTFLL